MKKLLIVSLFFVGLIWAVASFPGLARSGQYSSIVLNLRDDLTPAQLEQELQSLTQQFQITPRLNSKFSKTDHVYVVKGDATQLAQLQKSAIAKDSQYIEPNYIYNQFAAPNDPEYSQQWNFRSINVESAWEETQGNGVIIAVIDTGVSPVPDLKDTKFTKGYDFVHDRIEALDDVGHGTHVAGTIAQSTNNNYGVAGIAYQATIMPLKVLDESGAGTVADIAEAIRYAADNKADVINLSLGGAGESELLEQAINYAHSKGVVVVAAAGNSGDQSASYPARYPHAIGVAALDAGGLKAPYSNYGAGVDIAAPGGSDEAKILQNTIDPVTKEPVFMGYQGTSMAAPHVAGVAALIKASGVTEPDQILNVLKQGARNVTEDPLNHYGAGQLDAGNAVKLAVRGQITFQDFFRWLRDNGYLSPRFWIDGGAVALLPKVGMVLGSYLLAWLLRVYFPFNWSLATGLVAGSSGLFFLRGLYIFDLPQAPFRILGSSIPELGNALTGGVALNPLFASVLIPLGLIALLLGHPQGKGFAIGTAIGVTSCLMVNAVVDPQVWGLGEGLIARSFLMINALLCLCLAYLSSRGESRVIS